MDNGEEKEFFFFREGGGGQIAQSQETPSGCNRKKP